MNCNEKQEAINPAKKEAFLKEQIEIGTPVWRYLNNNSYPLNILDQDTFTKKIDSLKRIYTDHLEKNKKDLDVKTYNDETLSIRFAFDEFILEYPEKHQNFTGEKIVFSKENQQKIRVNLLDFNNPELLSSKELRGYVKAYITIESRKKRQSGIYNTLDNQQLHADWSTIETTFTNLEVVTYWKQEYLYNHIDNIGVKNIDSFYTNLVSKNKNAETLTRVINIYEKQQKERESHTIEIYKTVDNYQLEMHLFLPDKNVFKGKRPTLVQFHGGSWSMGSPFWFFSTAKEYAKNGWVVAVVEYRIKGRQGTYPFEAVKDAKSAIRWLRENADRYSINPSKILATGNSAGGHLALATTLVENWNEKTDNLKISAKPNALIVNSAAYDLTHRNSRWVSEKLDDKNVVKEISPYHLTKRTKTKMLLIHGEKDMNCPYSNASYFYEKMKLLGNDIQLHTVKDAAHFIWFGNYPEVGKVTAEYIQQLKF
ncbi:MAG: alpha/beta hydrolase [Flavobacteriaceae bacterium]|nr:alpha/beta hydrolase [Flavobacteriaceae bacterium]